jgi:hypothetical protein
MGRPADSGRTPSIVPSTCAARYAGVVASSSPRLASPTAATIVDAFYRIQAEVMDDYRHPPLGKRLKRTILKVGKRPRLGSVWREFRRTGEAPPKPDLAWVGDKKHAQHLDPAVRQFLRAHFPDARYIHVVRSPQGVVASTMRAAKRWRVRPHYFDGSAADILEQWAANEERVLEAKQEADDAILTVRLEDLCADPEATMTRMLDFLDLEMSDAVARSIPQLVYYRDPNSKYASFALPAVPRATRIMEVYGYA